MKLFTFHLEYIFEIYLHINSNSQINFNSWLSLNVVIIARFIIANINSANFISNYFYHQ